MKKILFPIAIVATLFVAGCAKENLVEPMGPQNGVTVLTAGIPTKTVLLNDQKVLWTSGDKLNVNGFESDALELDEPAATATFTIQGVISNPYKAVFPASIYKDEQTVALPAVQTYAEGSFGLSGLDRSVRPHSRPEGLLPRNSLGGQGLDGDRTEGH